MEFSDKFLHILQKKEENGRIPKKCPFMNKNPWLALLTMGFWVHFDTF